jgi:RNA polymerase sigma-70 factor (ECF subfamily)
LRAPDLSLEEHIDQLALQDWVWTAVSRLPETLRVTAMLRYFGSRPSYEEIALVLAVPVGTVKSRLNQVKIRLAEALLAAADLDHTAARLSRAKTAAYFAAATEQMNQGHGYGMFADAFSDNPELTLPDGTIVRGRRHLIESLDEDMNAGIRMHLSAVHASASITILEATFENPPDDPHHCPPATTQVHIQRNGKSQRVRLYFAPRPGVDEHRRADADAP